MRITERYRWALVLMRIKEQARERLKAGPLGVVRLMACISRSRRRSASQRTAS
jgi:hypothetical protein